MLEGIGRVNVVGLGILWRGLEGRFVFGVIELDASYDVGIRHLCIDPPCHLFTQAEVDLWE